MKLKIPFFLMLIALFNQVCAQRVDFEKYIIKHKDWTEKPTTKWEVLLKADRGSLQYVGADHIDEPSHDQFGYIKSKWDNFKPSIAFYEGPDRGIATTDTLTIQKFGESGYIRYLAKKEGIPAKSLEPPLADLYNYLVSKHSQSTVDMYMLSKEAMRLRTRKDLKKEQLTTEITNMLAIVGKMLARETAIKSIEQLTQVFEQQLGKDKAWWEAPASWFDPNAKNGLITNELALLSTEYRDIHMVKVLSESVLKGEKVFAVVGRNHVPLQINALKYNIGLLK